MYIAPYISPIGPMTMASDGKALVGLWFDGQKYDRAGLGETIRKEDLPVFEEARRWLDSYFRGEQPGPIPPLRIEGSDFRKLVADILLTIPYGRTMTYGEIAQEVARRTGRKQMSAQAVGGAVGHNRISIIVPCHRVVGSHGELTGYAGGTDKKEYLLKIENRTWNFQN